MKDFYKLLYGLLNPRNISDAFHRYYDGTTHDPNGHGDLDVRMLYGMRRGKLTVDQWFDFLYTLRKDTYKTILPEFIDNFQVTDELAEFLDYNYGIPREELLLLNEQKQNIKALYLFRVSPDGDDVNVYLSDTTMPSTLHSVLAPCIFALVNSYYDALVNFITFASSVNSKGNVHHLIGCCSPWLEEIFDVAFKDVFGEAAGMCCRNSVVTSRCEGRDQTILLKTVGNRLTESETKDCILDSSILILDSQSEEIQSGAKNRLYSWSNLVGDLATVPNVIKATRKIYVDSCYGYSFDSNLFLEGKALYNSSDSNSTLIREIANWHESDYLRVPFNKVPRVYVKNALELFALLMTMKSEGIVFRGQTSEYYLNRSPELMEKLYGEENAKEPSLASFALRNGDYFENHFTEWALLIKEYLALLIGPDNPFEPIEQMDVGNVYMFCLAIAQHYGLPTFGLDVSNSIATALFFSMFEYHSKTGESGKCQYIRKESGESAIYIFRPKEFEMFDYTTRFRLLNKEHRMFLRPIAQEASFAHASWGMSRNSIAERLLLAIHFDVQDINFEELNHLLKSRNYPSLEVNNFFPENDPFISFLQSKYLSSERPMNNYPHVAKFMEYLKKYIYQLQ